MQVVYERCCGLDVHKETVVACVLSTQGDGRVQRQVRTFSTMTAALRALSAWLRTQQVERARGDVAAQRRRQALRPLILRLPLTPGTGS